MNRLKAIFLSIVTCYFLMSSCTSLRKEDKAVYLELNDQLESSTKAIQQMALIYFKSLDSKTYDPHMAERARIWFSRAGQIQKLTSNTFDYIENLKRQIKSNNTSNQKNKLNEVIISFVSEISNIDSNMTKEFKSEFNVLPRFQDSITVFSSSLNPSAALCLLSKLQNRLSILESQLIGYCHNNVGSTFDGYYSRIPLINQNVYHLKPSEELEVNVGLGYLNYPSTPKVYISGDSLTRNDNGLYTYKLKVSRDNGKYNLPVKIEYYDEYLKKVTVTKNITYYIDQ